MGFLSVVITAAIIGFQGKLQYYEWISVLFVGVATGILTFETTLTSPSIGAKDAIRTWWVYRTYGVIALFSLVSVLFRVLLPENVLTNVIIAPLQMFLIPGLSLAIALLPVSASWIDYLAYGIPLSLGSQLVGLIWLDWVGIVVSTSTIYILAGCITLISFLIANYRAAHT